MRSLNPTELKLYRSNPDQFINFIFEPEKSLLDSIMSFGSKWYSPVERNRDGLLRTCSMHEEWQQVISEYSRVYIECPRGHAKTQRISIGRVLWELGSNLDLSIKIISNTDGQAYKVLNSIYEEIKGNKRLKMVFPNLKIRKYSDGQIFLEREKRSKEPSVESSGVLGSITGSRCDWLLADDVCDQKNTILTPKLKEKVIHAFYSTWLNLLPSGGGRLTYICTPYVIDDLSNKLKNSGQCMVYSQAIDDDFTPLWESAWPRNKLIERYELIGEVEFDRGYRLRYPDSEKTFPDWAIDQCSMTNEEFYEIFGEYPKFIEEK